VRRSSEETKAIILAAARERFAADGYERATIRAVAADARIDPSMVMRYFGSKEKLFAAAAHFDLELPDLAAAAREEVGRRLVAHFLDRWEDDEGLMVLLRSGVTNADAAERMRSIFASQLLPLVRRFTGGDDDEAGRRAALAASQVLGLALCRYLLAFPPMAAMSRDDIVDRVGPTLQRYLAGDESGG
jgi:AcrR family transcriptional regulator